MKLLNIIILFFLSILFNGCGVNFHTNPFPFSENLSTDTRLLGTWILDTNKTSLINKQELGNKTYQIKFTKNTTRYPLMLDYGDYKPSEVYTYVDSNRSYINLMSNTSLTTQFTPYKYSLTDNQLTIWFINVNRLAKAIKDKVILGDISKNNLLPSTTVHILGDVETLQNFLNTHNQEVYDTPIYFTRDKNDSN